MMRWIGLTALLLTGCSTVAYDAAKAADPTGKNALAQIAAFKVADLQAAAARAKAGNDPAGAQCYTGLLTVIGQAQAAVTAQGGFAGPIDTFEGARILANQGPGQANGVAQQINMACAALFVDAQATLVRLGVTGAAIGVKIP